MIFYHSISMAQFAEASSLPLPESPQPQPASPGHATSPGQDVMLQLAGLQKEMAKLRTENAMLREALVAQDEGEEETEKLEAEELTGAPVVLESFLMTPRRPPAPVPEADYWAEAPG